MRDLVADARRRNDSATALKLTQELDAGPDSNLEFMRLAFQARFLDQRLHQVNDPESPAKLERAAISTGGNPIAVAILARMAGAWGWKKEAVRLWWQIANRNIGQRQALAMLFEIAMRDKDTAELYRVCRRIYQVEPTSPVAKNNLAMFALLLREDLPEAHKLAEENFRFDSAEPTLLSTYAFSLYIQNRTHEALESMAKMPAFALENPSIAACYGILLCADGEKTKARPFLEKAEREKARLFPEELTLVDRALATL